MKYLQGFEATIYQDEPLKKYTSMRVGGPAKVFCIPETREALVEIIQELKRHNEPFRILGKGSNLIVRDEGVDTVVLKIDEQALGQLEIDKTNIRAEAGVKLGRLVAAATKAGLSGLEGLAGIPATVGGAVLMNAGGKFGNIEDCFVSAEILDLSSLQTYTADREAAAFGYRTSGFRDALVLEARFALAEKSTDEVKQRIQECTAFRSKTQPGGMSSAGCIFKNPPGDSAGKIIEELGFKGEKLGHAMVSKVHANYIVNTGNAKTSDILALIERIKARTLENRGIALELEVEIW